MGIGKAVGEAVGLGIEVGSKLNEISDKAHAKHDKQVREDNKAREEALKKEAEEFQPPNVKDY